MFVPFPLRNVTVAIDQPEAVARRARGMSTWGLKLAAFPKGQTEDAVAVRCALTRETNSRSRISWTVRLRSGQNIIHLPLISHCCSMETFWAVIEATPRLAHGGVEEWIGGGEGQGGHNLHAKKFGSNPCPGTPVPALTPDPTSFSNLRQTDPWVRYTIDTGC